MSEEAEVEITLADLGEGKDYIRSIIVKSDIPSYNNKTFKYRALTGLEWVKAMRNTNLSRDQDPAESFQFIIEIGKMGITSPGVGKVFGEFPKDVIEQVSGAIAKISKPEEKAVESFPGNK